MTLREKVHFRFSDCNLIHYSIGPFGFPVILTGIYGRFAVKCIREILPAILYINSEAKMIIHIATPQLVVFEIMSGEEIDEEGQQDIVRSVLVKSGLEQWSSIEMEEFTYRGQKLIFAMPIKIYIPNFLAALLN